MSIPNKGGLQACQDHRFGVSNRPPNSHGSAHPGWAVEAGRVPLRRQRPHALENHIKVILGSPHSVFGDWMGLA